MLFSEGKGLCGYNECSPDGVIVAEARQPKDFIPFSVAPVLELER